MWIIVLSDNNLNIAGVLKSVVSKLNAYDGDIGEIGRVLVNSNGVHDADSRASVDFNPLLLVVEVPTGPALKLSSVVRVVYFSVGVQDDVLMNSAVIVDVVGPSVGGQEDVVDLKPALEREADQAQKQDDG